MPIRKLARLAEMAATGLLVLCAFSTSVPASTALRTDPGNGLLTGPTTLRTTSADSVNLTFPTLTSYHCGQAGFDVDVTRNSSASSITGSLTRLDLTHCTDDFAGGLFSISACGLETGTLPAVHATATSTIGGTISLGDLTLRCPLTRTPGLTTQCYYTATPTTGQVTNASSRLTFSSFFLPYVGRSDSIASLCPIAATLSMDLTHLVQGATNRTVTLTTS